MSYCILSYLWVNPKMKNNSESRCNLFALFYYLQYPFWHLFNLSRFYGGIQTLYMFWRRVLERVIVINMYIVINFISKNCHQRSYFVISSTVFGINFMPMFNTIKSTKPTALISCCSTILQLPFSWDKQKSGKSNNRHNNNYEKTSSSVFHCFPFMNPVFVQYILLIIILIQNIMPTLMFHHQYSPT